MELVKSPRSILAERNEILSRHRGELGQRDAAVESLSLRLQGLKAQRPEGGPVARLSIGGKVAKSGRQNDAGLTTPGEEQAAFPSSMRSARMEREPARQAEGSQSQLVTALPADNREAGTAAQQASLLRLQSLLSDESWRPTRRAFELTLMTVRAPPQLEVAGHEAGTGPATWPAGAATAAAQDVTPGHGYLSLRDVTPMEGVPERFWCSATKTPSSHVTPIEGIPEREMLLSRMSGRSRLAVSSGPRSEADFWAKLSPLVTRGRNTAPSIAGSLLGRSFFGPMDDDTPGPYSSTAYSSEEDDEALAAEMDEGWQETEARATPAHVNSNEAGLPIPSGTAVKSPHAHILMDAECQTGASLGTLTPTGEEFIHSASGKEDFGLADPPAFELDTDSAREEGAAAADAEETQPVAAKPAVKPRRTDGETNQRLRRMYKERKSLAGLGTLTEEGKRRSTREKRRPLEWWRQECKIYQRQHASLPTVKAVITHTPDSMWKTVGDPKRSRFQKQ